MRKDDQIKLNFIINGDSARKTLNNLDKESQQLKASLKGMEKGTQEYIQTSKKLDSVRAKQKDLRKEIGISAMTIRELNKEAKSLRLMKSYLDPGTKRFKDVDSRLKQVNTRLKELRYGTKQSGLSLRKMADGFNRYLGVITGAGVSFAGVVMGSRKAVEEFNKFEQKMANLSALTGMVGDDLNYLGQEAAQMSTSVVEGNIRITQSAESILDAFTKVGSQRPELLKNKEALAAVTQDALILAEAGNMELAPAVAAVTTGLNQMNMQADESRRLINAIGAGSKVGAADIPYLTEAMEKTGTTANLMGMSVERVIAAIETVAPYYAEASTAGNSFDKVLLRMRSNNIGFVDGVFSLENAMVELEKRFAEGETAVDVFGEEHAKMAEVLVQNRDQFLNYTDAITGSNIALEQAAVNTDTNAAKLEQARNKYRETLRELGGMLSPIMTVTTNTFSHIMKTVVQVIKNYDLYRDVLISLLASYAAYNAQLIITRTRTLASAAAKIYEQGIDKASIAISKTATISTNLFALAKAKLTGNTIAAANAQKALKLVMASTPWGAILAGITAAAGALLVYIRNQNRVSDLKKAQKEINEQVNKQYDEQAATVIRLSSVIENGNLPLAKRKDAIEQLKNIMPEYNGYLDKEGKLHKHSSDQIELYLDNLKKKLYMNAMEGELQELIKKQVAAQRELTAATDRYNASLANTEDYRERSQKMQIYQGETMAKYAAAEKQAKKNLEDKTEAMSDLDNAILKITNDYEDLLGKLDDANTSQKSTTKATEKNTDAVEENKKMLKDAAKLQDTLAQNISETEKGINSLSTQIKNAYFQGDFELAFDLEKDRAALAAHKQALEDTNFVFETVVKMGWEEMTDGKLPVPTIDPIGAENLIGANINLQEQIVEIHQRYAQSIKDIDKDLLGSKTDNIMKWQEDIQNFMEKDVFGIGIQTIETNLSAWDNIIETKKNNRLKSLDLERQQELKNENLTEQQKIEIQEKYARKEAQIKQEAFRKQKNADIIKASIDASLATLKVLAAVPWPASIPLLAATATLAGAQIALIASQPVPQYSQGKYDVIGAHDGKTYNAPFIGSPKTGYYSRPALFAETGGEIIIDPRTTKNIMTNFPEIMQAIHAARVPQYNTGNLGNTPTNENLQQVQSGTNSNQEQMTEIIGQKLDQVVGELRTVKLSLLRGDVKTNFSLFELENLQAKRNQAENETGY
ncbi:MAG: phage tail tape measure protein [Bacteroidota bacterium]